MNKITIQIGLLWRHAMRKHCKIFHLSYTEDKRLFDSTFVITGRETELEALYRFWNPISKEAVFC